MRDVALVRQGHDQFQKRTTLATSYKNTGIVSQPLKERCSILLLVDPAWVWSQLACKTKAGLYSCSKNSICFRTKQPSAPTTTSVFASSSPSSQIYIYIRCGS